MTDFEGVDTTADPRGFLPRPGEIFLGIDPGATGGIAILEGKKVIFHTLPKDDRELLAWLKPYAGTSCQAAIEKVGGYIGMPQPGHFMFNFGRRVGVPIGMLLALNIPFQEVLPQHWQKCLGIPPRRKKSRTDAGESKSQWKQRLKLHAERLYPHLKLKLTTADALLIAHWLQVSCAVKRVLDKDTLGIGKDTLGIGDHS